MVRRYGARRRTAQLTRSQGIVLTAVLGLITAVLVVIFVIQLASNHGGKLHGAFGDQTFDMGKASAFAPEIARHGPLLFQDLLGHTRDIYVQHAGSDITKGWVAIEAHPDDDRSCALVWDGAASGFRDCHGTRYSADGAGLTTYPASVDNKGHVIVDLHAATSPGK